MSEREGLTDVIDALRAEVPVRDAWREALLRDVAAEPPPRRGRTSWTVRPWTVRPWAAAAAALLCAGIGAVGGHRLGRDAGAPVAAPAAVPVVASDGLVRAARDDTGTVVRFVLVAPSARRVTLVGDFNRWDAGATPLRADAGGRVWVADVRLAPGRHAYGFVVDGDVIADPAAPRAGDDDFGVPSSVLLVARPSA